MKIWTGRRDQRLADLKGTFIILHLLINIGCRPSSHRKSRRRMLWFVKLSGFASLATLVVLLSPSFQSEAFREGYQLYPAASGIDGRNLFSFRKAPSFQNAAECEHLLSDGKSPCDPSLVHVAITLDGDYLRGSMSAVHSILQHSVCPENIFFHFLVSDTLSDFGQLVGTTFPSLRFKLYFFDPERIRGLISSSVRSALEQPLNYARNYLSEILEPCVRRVIYLDSDIIVVDDIAKLWRISLGSRTVGAPEYCHANFTNYFTNRFWGDQRLSGTFKVWNPCYFNTGVMVIDLNRWRMFGYTRRIERWMEVQKSRRIYELGSLPPFLLVFAGRIEPIDHRWNQHGLGGDNVKGSCRNLHPGPVSLLHWSGSGKPWVRLDSNRPCPLDSLWAPYDLYEPISLSSSASLSSSSSSS